MSVEHRFDGHKTNTKGSGKDSRRSLTKSVSVFAAERGFLSREDKQNSRVRLSRSGKFYYVHARAEAPARAIPRREDRSSSRKQYWLRRGSCRLGFIRQCLQSSSSRRR